MKHQSYGRLLLMAAASFAAMYVLMYAMVDSRSNVLSNVNQAYMAALMAAPMVLIELVLMRDMYPNRRLNVALCALSIIALAGFFSLIRLQGGVTDRQFLRSMIPHHGSAILMCERTNLNDEEILRLCSGIISSQQSEIDWMKSKLAKIKSIEAG